VACFQRKVASLWKREAHGQLRTSTIYQFSRTTIVLVAKGSSI